MMDDRCYRGPSPRRGRGGCGANTLRSVLSLLFLLSLPLFLGNRGAATFEGLFIYRHTNGNSCLCVGMFAEATSVPHTFITLTTSFTLDLGDAPSRDYTVLTSAPYLVEYVAISNIVTYFTNAFTWSYARRACQALGEGYDIANVPNKAAHDAVHQLLIDTNYSKTTAFWIGGFLSVHVGDNGRESNVHRWTAGRERGKMFYNFTDSEPCAQSMNGESGVISDVSGRADGCFFKTTGNVRNTGIYQDIKDGIWYGTSTSTTAHGAVCSRSPCGSFTSASVEDIKRGLLVPSRYYPFCSETVPLSPTMSQPRTATMTVTLSQTASPSARVTPSETVSATEIESRSATIAQSMTASSMTASLPATGSLTETPSHRLTPTQTVLNTETVSATLSNTHSLSNTRSFSSSISASATVTRTLSPSAPSPSLSGPTASPSGSQSFTTSTTVSTSDTNSASSTATKTLTGGTESPSTSLEQSLSCYELPLPISNNTCTVVRPVTEWLATEENDPPLHTPFASSGLETAAANVTISPDPRRSCEAFSVPFAHWKGRKDSLFNITFQLHRSYAVVRGDVGRPVVEGRRISLVSIRETSNNSVTLLIQYDGPHTITSPGAFTVQFAHERLMRCPVSAPLRFTVVPLHSPEVAFGVAADAVRAIGGVVSMFAAMPGAASQMGMLASLQDMTRCGGADLGEDVDFSSNPLSIGIGDAWGSSHRGVFVWAAILIAAYSTLVLLHAYVRLWAARIIGPREGRPWPPRYRAELDTLGFPGCYITVAAFVIEPAAASGIQLVLFGRNTSVDLPMGLLLLLGGLGFIAYVFAITYREELVAHVPAEAAEGKQVAKDEIILKPTKLDQWITPHVGFGGRAAFFARHGSLVRDLSRVRFYRGIELLAVFLVAVLQGASYPDEYICLGQLIAAFIIILVLLAIVSIFRPLAARFDFVGTTVCLAVQAVAAGTMVANMMLAYPIIEFASILLIMVCICVSTVQAVVTVGIALFDTVALVKEARAAYAEQQAKAAEDGDGEDDSDSPSAFGPVLIAKKLHSMLQHYQTMIDIEGSATYYRPLDTGYVPLEEEPYTRYVHRDLAERPPEKERRWRGKHSRTDAAALTSGRSMILLVSPSRVFDSDEGSLAQPWCPSRGIADMHGDGSTTMHPHFVFPLDSSGNYSITFDPPGSSVVEDDGEMGEEMRPVEKTTPDAPTRRRRRPLPHQQQQPRLCSLTGTLMPTPSEDEANLNRIEEMAARHEHDEAVSPYYRHEGAGVGGGTTKEALKRVLDKVEANAVSRALAHENMQQQQQMNTHGHPMGRGDDDDDNTCNNSRKTNNTNAPPSCRHENDSNSLYAPPVIVVTQSIGTAADEPKVADQQKRNGGGKEAAASPDPLLVGAIERAAAMDAAMREKAKAAKDLRQGRMRDRGISMLHHAIARLTRQTNNNDDDNNGDSSGRSRIKRRRALRVENCALESEEDVAVAMQVAQSPFDNPTTPTEDADGTTHEHFNLEEWRAIGAQLRRDSELL